MPPEVLERRRAARALSAVRHRRHRGGAARADCGVVGRAGRCARWRPISSSAACAVVPARVEAPSGIAVSARFGSRDGCGGRRRPLRVCVRRLAAAGCSRPAAESHPSDAPGRRLFRHARGRRRGSPRRRCRRGSISRRASTARPTSTAAASRSASTSTAARSIRTRDDRIADPSSVARARAWLARRVPALAGAPVVETRVCAVREHRDRRLPDRSPSGARQRLDRRRRIGPRLQARTRRRRAGGAHGARRRAAGRALCAREQSTDARRRLLSAGAVAAPRCPCDARGDSAARSGCSAGPACSPTRQRR